MQKTLSNAAVSLSVDSFGAEMHSLQHDGVEYLWQADAAHWARHAPVLFPIVGKLKNNQYCYDGKTYEMGGHGFARDSEFELIEETTDKLVYQLTDSETTRAHYPFHFQLQVSYQLIGNSVTVSYDVANTDDKPLYFGIGAHPAFNVPLQNGNFEDYQLTISPAALRQEIPLDPPTGLLKLDTTFEIEKTVFPLTRELFKDDALVFKSTTENVEIALTNKIDNHGVTVSFENMPYFGLWSPYATDAPFACIEPWCGLADAENTSGELTEKFAINALAPADSFHCQFAITLK